MALEGVVPGKGQIKRLSDTEIIDRLTQIKGVGRWTVEMLLIFSLGRPDVLPVDDFGIRTGFAIVYKKRKLPEPKQILKHGERWKPYRSIASWYLWRAVDLASGDAWAAAVARLPGASVPMEGFGSSDCDCETHLFWFEGPPSFRKFRQRVKTLVPTGRAAARYTRKLRLAYMGAALTGLPADRLFPSS